ncbi:hypothetical protein LMG6001_01256 [Achromobacter insolitus]|uniref:methyltransferase regulatory domain-containing protein n=1 Tax=Achromobacter insolitus TaxID=217204 RepID=UPI001467BDC3|nr:class I SAM-dependent methyltransferase [Achromobacter insolitus]CAB3946655.1 hypothetical protein LMG6001_01256 [Achromobacter insolitus]
MNTHTAVDQQIAADYDNVPYTSHAFHYAGPRHLRATAFLYGIDTVPLEHARVLELGCASGGNLLPFAAAYPDAQVVGVDLSSVQVDEGLRVVSELGLKNVQLHAMSLADITPDFGEFDYIIAHGVLSWVPPEVKAAILRICRENLAPNGLAYISYNTYPGWKANDVLRDAMMLNTYGAADDADRLARGKAMLLLLSQGMARSNPMASALSQAVAGLERYSDYYLTHEYLEAFNTPCYLVEFVSAAQDVGLAYVGDAESQTELPTLYGQNVQLHLSLTAIGQPKAMRQQFLDFAIGRSFRKSMLVHAESASSILDLPDPSRLAQLRFAGMYVQVNNSEASAAGQTVLRNQAANELTTNDPMVLATTEALSAAWPGSLPFADIVAMVKSCAPEPISDEAAIVSAQEAVSSLYRIGMVHLAREPLPNESGRAEGLPNIDPAFLKVLRMRERGKTMTGGFNLWHENVNLTLREAEGFVLQFLNGQHSVRQLRALLCDAWTQGKVSAIDGKSLRGKRNLDGAAQNALRALLELLRYRGVLSGSI